MKEKTMNAFNSKIHVILILLIVVVLGCNTESPPNSPNDKIPSYLTGVWTTENPKFQQQLLLDEGVGVYLDSDGTGFIFAAEPAIVFLIKVKYEQKNETIFYEIIAENEEGEEKHGKMRYHPSEETLILIDHINNKEVSLERQFNEVNDDTLKMLGLNKGHWEK